MKRPDTKEEYLVWPPIGSGIGVFVGVTVHDVLLQYHHLIMSQQGDSLYAGYLFPIVLGIAFAARLKGKYWLGFAWTAVMFYIVAWLCSLGSPTGDGFVAASLMVCVCLSILFSVQTVLLFIKRKYRKVEAAG